MTPSPFHGIFSSFGTEADGAEMHHGDSFIESTPVSVQDDTSTVRIGEQKGGTRTGQIAVDIYEQDSYYIIRAPIAGVKLSDLDIEVDGKVITIRGKRELTDDVAADQYYLQECFWGDFSRSITLPCTIDPKKIKATFSRDSILKILVPKEEKVKIIRIQEG